MTLERRAARTVALPVFFAAMETGGSVEKSSAAGGGRRQKGKKAERVKVKVPQVKTDEAAKRNIMAPRIAIYVLGVLLTAFGVVLNTRCAMGASTVNCIPYVFSEACGISLGQGCMILYAADILIQIIVFRTFTVRMALQIPFSFVFGAIVDVYDWLIGSGILWFFQSPDLLVGSLMLVLGIVFTGVGVSMIMNMNFVPNPPDGCTQALCKITGLPFGRGKWLNDGLRLIIACVCGLVLTGQIIGVGIGTVICVFAVGNMCQFTDDRIGRWYRRVYNPTGIVD